MKLFIIAALVCLSAADSAAQKLEWKPTVSVNLGFVSVEQAGKYERKPGFDAGLLVGIPLRQRLSLQTGILYTHNRGSLERAFIYPPWIPRLDVQIVRESYSLNHLKLPLLLLKKSPEKHPWFWNGGLLVKYALESHRKGVALNAANENYAYDFTITTKGGGRAGLGGLFGFGKEFEFQNQTLSVGLNLDSDISAWRYPTNSELEGEKYFRMRNHNVSLLVSVGL